MKRSPIASQTLHRSPRRTARAVAVSLAGLVLGSTALAQSTLPTATPAEAMPGPIRLILPPILYAVPGLETNVYFDNVALMLNPANYAFDVTCERGRQQAERWTYTPADDEIGQYPFRLEVRDEQNTLIAWAQSQLHVAPAEAGAGRAVSMLFIGDSLTNAGVYPRQVLDLCAAPHNPTLTLVGSHFRAPGSPGSPGSPGTPGTEPPAVRHEGYGGWTAERFATRYTGTAREGEAAQRGSPFLYVDQAGQTPKLDYTRYCQDVHGGAFPEFVTIFLGCNDVFSATDDTIEARTDAMFQHLDALIAMIHANAPATHIGLMLPVPPAATQDAFGANYRTGQTRWQYKRNQHRVVERMLQRYADRASQRITLVPTPVNLDCLHGYPTVEVAANARSQATLPRLNNGVHPAATGYQQIGDTVYAWLKARLAEAGE